MLFVNEIWSFLDQKYSKINKLKRNDGDEDSGFIKVHGYDEKWCKLLKKEYYRFFNDEQIA